MSSDEFLDGLKGEWQESRADLGDALARLEANEARLRAQKRGALLGGAGFALLGVAFFATAISMQSFLFQLGAAAFLAAALMMGINYRLLQRVTGDALLQDTASVLDRSEKQARTAMRLTEAMLGSATLLVVCALIAVGHALLGDGDLLRNGVLAAIWLACAVGSLLRYPPARAAAAAELEHVRAMRAELNQPDRA